MLSLILRATNLGVSKKLVGINEFLKQGYVGVPLGIKGIRCKRRGNESRTEGGNQARTEGGNGTVAEAGNRARAGTHSNNEPRTNVTKAKNAIHHLHHKHQ